MITLDTSGLFALLNRLDKDHERVKDALYEDRGPYLVPAGILSECAYMIETRLRVEALESFLHDMDSGGFTLDCGEKDFPRVRELVRRYEDLPLGFADASVISCAERNGGKVLTLDLRHFGVVAGESKIFPVP
ncbi:MAG: PIN domain-containing protein [Rubrobacter sp.]|nr:PIN domain-containing protein [Rubrobacter sp.]MBA3610260.1 PIN domain-containing protein [Rubrobacter sp.]